MNKRYKKNDNHQIMVFSRLTIASNCLSLQNSELLTLTYGALVSQMLRDYDNVDDVNKKLEQLGYNMGMRIIEDFLSRTNSARCLDMNSTAEKIQLAFR
jgi:trafficking protein particle complex subunit 3